VSRRLKIVWGSLGAFALLIVCVAVFGSQRAKPEPIRFMPPGSLVFDRRLPAKFGAASRQVYTWKGSFTDALAAARKELLTRGWREYSVRTGTVSFNGRGQMMLVEGVGSDPGLFITRAKSKNEAFSSSWQEKPGFVSVMIDREDGSLVEHSRGLLFETLGLGR
jgi:hypothetical protein